MRFIGRIVLISTLALLPAFVYPAAPHGVAGGGGPNGSIMGRVAFDGQAGPQGVVVTDAIVYLVGEGLDDVAAEPAGPGPVLDQVDITYVPHVLPVMVGVEVDIRNSDGITHNVKTRSRENRPFNRAQVGSMSMQKAFDMPEVVTVVCNIHSQMSAYIVVVPNAFYARVNEDGTFAIEGAPPGDYQLVAWHEDYGETVTHVSVAAGGTSDADINFHSSTD